VRSRSTTPEVYQATSPPIVRGMPMVILQDGYTASAAEIIAGALQDHDRALVVGMPSFGKGLVQTAFPLADGWLLKMTTGKWFTPSGRSIHRDRPFANGRFVTVDTPPLGRTATAIRAGRPRVQSDAGRVLYGGGGIVPDVIVPADTLTDPEQHLMVALRAHGSTAGVVLYRLARDLQGTVRADFAPSPAWRDLYAARLRTAGVVLNRALIDSAGPMVDDLIAGQLDEIAFGDSAAFTRSSVHDLQFLRAVKLLDGAHDLTSLLDAARRDDG
jgi:carboxyl-terminal processing protease